MEEITPQNITGESIEWTPTNQLRFAGRRRKEAELEQLWINQSTREREWREIPFTHRGRN